MIRIPFLALAVLLVTSLPLRADEAHVNALAGTWGGSSICTNRHAAPDCKDERVIYTITPAKAADTVTLKADKVVGGQAETMYELPFSYDTAKDNWISEIDTKSFKGRWSISLVGGHLYGSLIDRASNAMIRRVSLTRN